MDESLVNAVIDRDWTRFVGQAHRLGFRDPTRTNTRIDLPVRPPGTEEDFLAVLLCDGYDAQPPLLDFADPEYPEQLGGAHWPRIEGAPMNSVLWNGRTVPIICTPGTRGYHLHQSHCSEQHPRESWRLSAVVTIVWRFLRMGPYKGRGI